MPQEYTKLFEGISPESRAAYIVVGEQFGSPLVIGQVRATLAGFKTHGKALSDFGSPPEDAVRLQAVVDGLVAAGGEREGVRLGGRGATQRRNAAFKTAKNARLRGRTVLTNLVAPLREKNARETQRVVDSALDQTGAGVGWDAARLDAQLVALGQALAEPAVADAAKTRGGPGAASEVVSALAELRASRTNIATGGTTRSETETLDLLDGIALEIMRSARRSARSAARALGQPALADAFELKELYGPTASGLPTLKLPTK